MVFNYIYNDMSRTNLSEFKSMINNLDSGDNICDKDVILGLYYTLYNVIISPIELINVDVAREFSKDFNRIMNTIIRLSKARKDIVSVESFIGNFFYYLDNSELSHISPISDILDLIKNDLDTFISVEKNVFNKFALVDKDFTLEERIAISIQYKNYLSDLYFNMTSIYGVDETSDMLAYLNDCLNNVFSKILSVSNTMDRFNGEMKNYIKDKLLELSLDNKFDFYNENNQFIYDLIQVLNDEEIKVFKLYYLYKLALFKDEDFITMNKNDEVMSLELEMDRVSFKKALVSSARKSKMLFLKQSLGFGKVRKKKK